MGTQDKVAKGPRRFEILRRFQNYPSLFHSRIGIKQYLPESPRIAHLRSNRKRKCENASIASSPAAKARKSARITPANASQVDILTKWLRIFTTFIPNCGFWQFKQIHSARMSKQTEILVGAPLARRAVNFGQVCPQNQRRFSVFANCHCLDLAHPARREFLAGNDDAEGPLAGWQRLAILGVRQEHDAVNQFRVK